MAEVEQRRVAYPGQQTPGRGAHFRRNRRAGQRGDGGRERRFGDHDEDARSPRRRGGESGGRELLTRILTFDNRRSAHGAASR